MKNNDLYTLYAKSNGIKVKEIKEIKEVEKQEDSIESEVVDSKKKNKFLNSIRNEHIQKDL